MSGTASPSARKMSNLCLAVRQKGPEYRDPEDAPLDGDPVEDEQAPLDGEDRIGRIRFSGWKRLHIEYAFIEDDEPPSRLSAPLQKFLESFLAAQPIGRAAKELVRADLETSTSWAERHHDPKLSPLPLFLSNVMMQALYKHLETRGLTHAKLDLEFKDERFRDDAAKDQGALERYLQHWKHFIRKRQIGWPRWAGMPGYSAAELCDELVVKLLEAVRTGKLERYAKPGREATFLFLDAQRRAMRKRRQIYVLTDPGNLPTLRDPDPTPEQKMLREERRRGLRRSLDEDLPSTLTKRQREWLWLFRRHSAEHDKWNAAAVADEFGRNRSSAKRMMGILKEIFTEAGVRDLLEGDD